MGSRHKKYFRGGFRDFALSSSGPRRSSGANSAPGRRSLLSTSVCLLLIAAMSLAGCGKKEKVYKDDKIHVTWWHAMGGGLGPIGRVLATLVHDFNASQDSISVDPVNMGNYTALSQKIIAAAAAKDPPVMAQAYEAWTSQLLKSGMITPIDEFIDGPNGLDEESQADLIRVFVDGNTFMGRFCSFPFNKSVMALYYNRDLFRKAGLDPEKPPSNWDEYRKYAEILTEDFDGDGRPDQWGVASQMSVWIFENLLLQNGGSLLTPDGKRVLFDSPEGEEALDFYYRMTGKEDVGYVTGGFDFQNDFTAGTVGMIQSSSVSLSYMKSKLTFDLGIAPMPGKVKNAMIVSGTNLVVFSRSTEEEKRAAWAFIKWLGDTPQTAYWAAETGYVPIRWSALEHSSMIQKFEDWPGYKDLYTQLEYADYEPSNAAWMEGREFLSESIEGVLRGVIPPGKALADAAKKTNALLRMEHD